MSLEQRLLDLVRAIAGDMVVLGNRYRSYIIALKRNGSSERIALPNAGLPILLRSGTTAIVPVINEQLQVIVKDGSTVYISTY